MDFPDSSDKKQKQKSKKIGNTIRSTGNRPSTPTNQVETEKGAQPSRIEVCDVIQIRKDERMSHPPYTNQGKS